MSKNAMRYELDPSEESFSVTEETHSTPDATDDDASDTISVYLKSLSHTTLLTRQEETVVAREMERQERRAIRLLARAMAVADYVVQLAQRLQAEGLRLSDLLVLPRGEDDADGERCEAPLKPDLDERQERALCEKFAAIEAAQAGIRAMVAQPNYKHNHPNLDVRRLRVQIGRMLYKLPFNKTIRRRLEIAWGNVVDDALTLKAERARLEYRLKDSRLDAATIRLLKHQLKAVRAQIRKMECDNALPLDAIISSWKRFAETKQKAEAYKLRMIESNLKLVVFIGRDFMGRGLAMEDLIQEGNIGLIRAVEKFDWRRGIKFSTYAVWWIKQAIQLAIANQSRTIRLPTYMVDRVNRVRRVLRQMTTNGDEDPTPEEIAPLVGLSPDDVRQVLNVVTEPVSLETPTADDDGEHSLGDLLPDHNTQDPLRESMTVEMAQNLREALSRLSARESEVLMRRFGLMPDGREWTLEEIGAHFQLTRERIRQIEMRALAKLSHPSRSRKLRDALHT
ncbi:MAG: sigma-70 family RNA polymerase sigma factor [Chloracidobacterium sp.]|uniref:RNA polymerase sigma factor n=1 Tax=Chloracidobacterium validum TaxID=2821543 RepID=A0ABX8BAX2_9BACT|nr:sigma-70 family RNA polymerase sigma factor [Chloracidobacterium validum]QUW03811.1 sigma-70 family RNA polymerase sigma factor [Chloracidobacterium validum]